MDYERVGKVIIRYFFPAIALLAVGLAAAPQVLIHGTRGYVASSGFLVLIRVTLIEAAFLLAGLWALFNGLGTRPFEAAHRSSRVLLTSEAFTLMIGLSSLLFSSNYERPTVFFVSMCVFYVLLFFDAQNADSSRGYFLIKLLIGQVILIESFSLL